MGLNCRSAVLVLLAFLCACGGAWAQPVTEADLRSAEQQYRAEGAATALPEFERLAKQYAGQGDAILAARAERFVGESHWRLGDFERARLHLESALAVFRGTGERLQEARVLNVLGLLEWDLGNYGQAIENFEHASGIGQSEGDARLAGATLNNTALVYDELGDYDRSLALYEQALARYEGADFPRGESDTLGNIGGVYLLLGRYDEALTYFRKALAISESLQLAAGMSIDNGNIALCHLGMGEIDTAIGHFDIALERARDAGMRKEEALWQRGKANALMYKGHLDQSLVLHRQALAAYEAIGAQGLKLDALHDMGRLHLTLGDLLAADRYFQQALEEARRIGQQQVVTANLLALGDIQYRYEQFEQAAEHYAQAAMRADEAGELNYRVLSLLSLARANRELDRPEAASGDAARALAIARDNGYRHLEAEAHFMQGELARDRSRMTDALDHYAEARSVIASEPDPGLLWQVHYGAAQAMIGLGRRLEAVAELQAAATLIESVRERLKEERFKAGYVHDKYQVYIDLVRLQLELGRTGDAFSTAERLRARNFFEQLESTALPVGPRSGRQRVFALRERVRQLQKALAEEQELPRPDRRQRAVETFSRELLLAEREYQAALDEDRGKGAVEMADAGDGLAELQDRLLPDEALLEYVVGESHLMVFVVRANRLEAIVEPLDSRNLAARIDLVRELVQDTASEAWAMPAAGLSRGLIGPAMETGLLAGARHLYLVPHGILNLLPFALLPADGDPDSPVLVERFTLSYLPAARLLAHDAEPTRTDRGLLALAPSRARLRYAVDEARDVSALFEPRADLLSGPAATESAFKSAAGAYAMLHLSTHAYFNADSPLLSGLELEADDNNDGQLEVHEILDLPLQARLVTLSACETGLGSGWLNRQPAGDDLVGLTRAFLLAGSGAVLASLWEVDDRSTVTLMNGFYRGLKPAAGGADAAASLALTQRDLLGSDDYNHPYYWAPFVLVGQNLRLQRPGEIFARR